MHDRVVVAVDEVRDRLDHAVLDAVVDARHEAVVEDREAAVGRADEVACFFSSSVCLFFFLRGERRGGARGWTA